MCFSILMMNYQALRSYCERDLPRVLDFLQQMVAINSFTENPAGINRLGELTAQAFAQLGFLPRLVQAAGDRHGKHLILRRTASAARPTIGLISHLDTVFTPEEEERNGFRWRRQGSRIYGPGTNDIKGGTALLYLMLGALRAEARATFESTNWVVLLNACEEVSSADFGDLCRTELRGQTRAALVFEADGGTGDVYSLVSSRKGRATFSVEVSGRGAHAGSQHKHGANAVVELADVVGRIAAITDYSSDLTVNVGSFHGGTVTNRVPHFARAELEMRAFDANVYAGARARILALSGRGHSGSPDRSSPPCDIEVKLESETQPWPPNEATETLLEIWRQSAQEIGISLQEQARGGLSDGNVLWQDFPTLDGLGPRGENSHCSEQSADGSKVQEWVDTESFVPKAVLNALAIGALLRGDSGS